MTGPLPTTDDGNRFVLTMTDYYTKFVDFFALQNKQASGIALCIWTFVCR